MSDPSPEVKAALIASNSAALIARLAGLNQLAVTGLQSLVLINGGAIVALFSLIAQGAASPFVARMHPPTLWVSFAIFCAAIASALSAMLIGHYSQNMLYLSEEIEARSDRAQFLGLRPISEREEKERSDYVDLGNGLLNWAIGACLLSLTCFCTGAGFALWAALGAASRIAT